MRRADRLIKLTHFLRSRRQAVTAKGIAETFGICTRTVYRDIHDLMDSGVPITGEAGVGYVIDKQYYLPPLTFDADELEAIALGISMVRQWTDEQFASKAENAFEKIQAVLPTKLQGEIEQITTYSIPTKALIPWTVSFSGIRECIRTRQKIHIDYRDEKDRQTTRTLRPLALLFFNPVWLLGGWCEKRNDFRNFRIDRIVNIDYSEEVFEDEEGKDLKAYMLKEGECNEK
ncbi:MAG: helix-turn-helix transcriptional regulator [Cellvibrionaceae bacterium]